MPDATRTSPELLEARAAFFTSDNIGRLIDHLPVALWVKDTQGRFLGGNQQWLFEEDLSSLEDIIGQNDYDLFDHVRAAGNIARSWEVLDAGRALTTVEEIERNGENHSVRVTRVPLRDTSQAIVGVVGLSEATGDRVTPPSESLVADVDPITGVGSCDALELRLQELLGSTQPSALMLIQLDNHSMVSDSLGHDFGDMLLRAAARRLTGVFGPHLFRNRANEFAAVLPTTDSSHIEEIGQTLLDKWRQPLVVDRTEIYGSVSIGATLLSEASRPRQVRQDAELATNAAQESGGSRFVLHTAELRSRADDALAQQMLVRRAVANREFNLHWQPIVDVQTGAVRGCEGLLRWRPAGGAQVLPAAEFLPFLDRSGLIVQVGKSVMESACRQYIAWREHNRGPSAVRIFINMSARQFAQPRVAEALLDTLQKHGVPPAQLAIEMPAATIADVEEDVLVELEDLRARGVRLALDEFGASDVSLTALDRVNVDFAKIDRRLIQRVQANANEPFLDAIKSVLADRSVTAVVQGVETEEQLDWLRDRGWDMAQGYHIGKPLDGHDLAPNLAATNRMAS